MARIYTRSGDNGETGLVGGARVRKDDPLIRAMGDVDELNAVIGVARATGADEELDAVLASPQNELFEAGAALAAPGDGVYAAIRRSDGAILQFWVSRGWSADPPDVRVSETEAREIACSLYGGNPGSWSVSLRYVPDERRPKTQRLAYTMGRGQPGGSVGLMIDARTGEVIWHSRAGDQPAPPPGYEPGKVVEGWEPNPGPGPSEGFGRQIPFVVYVACAVFFGSSLFLLWRVMRR